MATEMPAWPQEFRCGETANEMKALRYERARATAAIARLRYLTKIAITDKGCWADAGSDCEMCRVLSLIGEIPE